MLGASTSLPPLAGRRILALRPGALGDTILAIPALAALRRRVGESGTLDFVGTEPFVRLACSAEHAGSVFSFDRSLFTALYHAGAENRGLDGFLGRYDLVVCWSKLPLLRSRLRPLAIEALEAPPLPPRGVHASDHLFDALSPLGIEGPAPPPRLVLSKASRRLALELLHQLKLEPGRFVAIHPSSGSPRKNWPAEKFAELANLVRTSGRDFLWVEGEADADVVGGLERQVPAPVARRAPLDVLAALLGRAWAYFGNDSGISHLAAASGARTFALFGPTDPRTWAPRGFSVTVVDFGEEAGRVWAKALEACPER